MNRKVHRVIMAGVLSLAMAHAANSITAPAAAMQPAATFRSGVTGVDYRLGQAGRLQAVSFSLRSDAAKAWVSFGSRWFDCGRKDGGWTCPTPGQRVVDIDQVDIRTE